MSDAVVEVGPARVRGPRDVATDMVSAALEYIDDELGLLDERAVAVADLWADLMRAAAGRGRDAVILVCPTWWSTARIERVRAAAAGLAPDIVVRSRGPLLADTAARDGTTVVEIAAELIVVTGHGPAAVIPIDDDVGAVTARVSAAVGIPIAVLIDAPTTVHGARSVATAIADHLRDSDIAVVWADDDAVRRAAAASLARPPAGDECRSSAHRPRKAPALAGVVSAAAMGVAFALGDVTQERGATTLLVEGRIAVVVPAAWPVRRITAGPGSARLQLVSPSSAEVALHLTQSADAVRDDLRTAAESLRAALAGEPDEVFVGFQESDVRAGRPAVTYREVRRDRHVAWTVLVDRGVRIAIGCQSPPAREDMVREACDQAVGSARAAP